MTVTSHDGARDGAVEGSVGDDASAGEGTEAGARGWDGGRSALPDASAGGADASAGDTGVGGIDGTSSAADDADAAPPACALGVYIGSFAGEVTVGTASRTYRVEVAGDLVIGFEGRHEGSRLVLENGYLRGVDDNGTRSAAQVHGVLNCDTGSLEDGQLVDGMYSSDGNDLADPFFRGELQATYEPGDVPRLVGTWHTQGRVISGEGPFEVSLAGATTP